MYRSIMSCCVKQNVLILLEYNMEISLSLLFSCQTLGYHFQIMDDSDENTGVLVE